MMAISRIQAETEAAREVARGAATWPAPFDIGRFLAELMAERGLSTAALARHMKVPQTRIGDILRNRRPITADTALRFGRVLGMPPELFLRLQNRADLAAVRQSAAAKDVAELVEIAPLDPPPLPAAAVRRALERA